MIVLCTCVVRFIGGNFVFGWRDQCDELVVNLEECTYAGNLEDLVSPQSDALHVFLQGDIANGRLLDQLLGRDQPLAVLHLPAQSNVDRLSLPAHLHRREVIELVGRSVDFVQDNHERLAKNVLHDLHYQVQQPPKASWSARCRARCLRRPWKNVAENYPCPQKINKPKYWQRSNTLHD